jgi:hypothetical protein
VGQVRTIEDTDPELFENPITKRLVTKRELAQILAVSDKTISRQLPLGLAEAAGVLVGERWRFNVFKAWTWFRERGNKCQRPTKPVGAKTERTVRHRSRPVR